MRFLTDGSIKCDPQKPPPKSIPGYKPVTSHHFILDVLPCKYRQIKKGHRPCGALRISLYCEYQKRFVQPIQCQTCCFAKP